MTLSHWPGHVGDRPDLQARDGLLAGLVAHVCVQDRAHHLGGSDDDTAAVDPSWEGPCPTGPTRSAPDLPHRHRNVSLAELVAHVCVQGRAHHLGGYDDDIAAVDPWWE